jgi:hypothetical protein
VCFHDFFFYFFIIILFFKVRLLFLYTPQVPRAPYTLNDILITYQKSIGKHPAVFIVCSWKQDKSKYSHESLVGRTS